ncbi:MFS transporter [Streptomyces mobaraensis]|uniref:MFS transporter n=1 Tax=Streptomyces mobaraensis TaxID=35621 RepID=UPI001F04E70C|nr:MFS transporter [Streptomyces mobaraensis]
MEVQGGDRGEGREATGDRAAGSREGAAEPRLRRARLAVAAVFAVHGAVTGNFATRVPWIRDHLRLDAGELGLALAFPAIGAALAMPLAGRVAHRFGTRAALRGLLALWCASLALPALSPGLPVLCAALAVYGAASGTADVAMNALGVETEERLGRSIMSGLHGMWSAGALAGSAAGTVAAHAGTDARWHLGAAAVVLTLLGAVVCGPVLDVRPRAAEHAPPRFALPPRSALVIGAVGFCAVFAEGASLEWSAVYLRDVVGSGAGLAAACTSAFSCAMAAARFAGDAAVRRFGPVRTVRAGGVLAACGGALVVGAPGAGPAIAGFALVGLGIAVVVPLAFAAAARSGPEPSQAIAGVATITYTSGLVAPSAIGQLADATSLTVSFGLVTVLAALLAVTAGALRPGIGGAARGAAAEGG